jgi:hypothetical protein
MLSTDLKVLLRDIRYIPKYMFLCSKEVKEKYAASIGLQKEYRLSKHV